MKIYLYLPDKIESFTLPNEVFGSFSFDENRDEEAKLINIEARDNQWVLYQTTDVRIISGNNFIKEIVLAPYQFYFLQRNAINYLIYVSQIPDKSLKLFSYDKNIDIVVGNDPNANIFYNCMLIKGIVARIHYVNGVLVLENNNINIYVNNRKINNQSYYIQIGDTINIYGLKIQVFPQFLLINNPNHSVIINEIVAKIQAYILTVKDEPKNIEIKDIDLYKPEDYFSKAPRLRRLIETKQIKLSPPPRSEGNQELPLILTIGPMLTMGVTSLMTLINTFESIYVHETTFEKSKTSIITSLTMLVSMLLWPLLTKFYNDRQRKKQRKLVEIKYSKYLAEKKEELENERNLQKEILLENLISVEECVKIIQKRTLNLWDKRIDQSDFLVVRVGMGNEKLDAEVEYPDEGFTIDEDKLKKQADAMVEQCKYIENVPIGYSFYENKLTAILGNKYKSIYFTDNIILQLITFYSYEDLKLVIFTDESKKDHWDYVKYLNHNWTNDRNFRFFASNSDDSKAVAEYLNYEVENRLAYLEEEKKNILVKPYYLIIVDSFDAIKKFNFTKTITELDNNIGFSMIMVEERIRKLPSKCNNFINLGEKNSGILKNSYEKQEVVNFYDEINYKIDMMSLAKIVSNIPIELEKGARSLPDMITFLELEKVGKVEQLNIINRWNSNDATTSLKAEIGVDEDGEYLYLDLHEKFHGPHGLIAGTTGSGKSEFIITYILSMAINYSPDDVAFILIDYKGGGLAFAFENKTTGESLPHLVGTITNLDKAEMDRTLVSIDSEVKRRQAKFNEARDALGESTIDIYKYQKFYKEGKLSEPIPHLFIVCDEFAELKSQQPDFMDNLISIARIGRSLGVHLILATQKPSGVVNDQIWSNSKFHICLKVQDEADSKEMLKRPDAASLKQTGRFYLQVGYDEYFVLGQSAWCGAKYYPSDKIIKQVDKSVNVVNEIGAVIKSIQASKNIKIEAQGEQLGVILKNIIEVATKTNKFAKRLWRENIPAIILIDALIKKYDIKATPYDVVSILGEYDAPEKQEQGLLTHNFIEQGNIAIYGTDSKETEMFITSIIYSTMMRYTPAEINFYVIDYGSQYLRIFEKAPHVGGFVLLGEDEKYVNLFKMLREELEMRKKLFADYGGEYKNFIKNSTEKMPLKVIIMNNFDSINEIDKNLFDTFSEYIRDSERYGIIYILTGNSTSSISRKFVQSIQTFYAFKLKDPTDYLAIFNVRSKLVPRDIIGRGLYKDETLHEFQTASIVEDENKLNDFILEKIKELKAKNNLVAKPIPTLPEQVRLSDIESEIKTLDMVPIGIGVKNLEIMKYDFKSSLGTLIGTNKLKYALPFMNSLIDVLEKTENTNIFIFDPGKLLIKHAEKRKNYYTDYFDKLLDNLINYINNVKEKKITTEEIVILFNFKSKLRYKIYLYNLVCHRF